MYEIGIEGLQKLLAEGRAAVKYAWDNYEELSEREHTYTLYGPYAYNIGASVPSKLTPNHARKLMKKTNRKNFHIYELDENYKVLRTKSIMDYTRVECVYHHFELNGIVYAYPFRGNGKEMFNDDINVLKFSEGLPVYFGIASSNFLFAQFFEHTEPGKMLVSTYRFFPDAKYTMYGYPVDWSAPVGALNSPVDRHCTDEVSEYIDFSCWFK